MDLAVLFVDMNAYFASVEQQDQPELRGRPVCVTPVVTETGCCIATSYEAKRHNVVTGTRVWEGRRRCPGLCVVESRPPLYVKYHDAIAAAVDTCLPITAVHSIDELSCRLADGQQEPAQAAALAGRIKLALRRQVGEYVLCSIGVASNRILAKVASDMRKPDGLTILTSDQLPHRLFELNLTDLPGIGSRMEERLHRHGVKTVEALWKLTEREMGVVWGGVVGREWWYHLHGQELPEPLTRRRTVSHSHVLPPALRNLADARGVMVRLIHRAAARMRDLGFWARRIAVFVAMPDGVWKAEARLGLCQDTLTMIEVFSGLWRKVPAAMPLQIGVTLLDLVSDSNATLPLFPGDRRRVRLAETMDRLNARYGVHTVYFAGMDHTRHDVPVRISYTQIPRLHTPEG